MLLEQEFNFILVCRPESHPTMYEHLEGISLPTVVVDKWTGKFEQTYPYRYLNELLELVDDKYKLLRSHLSTRKTFFNDLRALTRYLAFDSWDHLLTFMIQGLELDLSPNSS